VTYTCRWLWTSFIHHWW